MARTPTIMGAGGIVLRREQPPLVAVVRLRKRDEWVLPKGKLDPGETPRDAAKREVLEETGHEVSIHEFLGTLVLETPTRVRIVHYWRMEANAGQTHPLMDDIRAVDWLPLDAAVARLSRSHEKAFLENVGPYALAGLILRTKAKPAAAAKPKPATPKKRRSRTPEPAEPAVLPTVLPEVAAPVSAEPILPVPEPALPPIVVEETNQADVGTEAVSVEVGTEAAESIDAVVADAVEAEPVPEEPASREPERREPEHDEPGRDEPAPEQTETPVIEQPQVAAEPAPARTGDVERVQAAVAEIRSMVSAAVAVETAAEPAEVQEPAAQRPQREPETAPSEAAKRGKHDKSGDTAPAAEPERRSLAQKVRGWFGNAA
jgi:8-oxo-dGTP diphosphatase